MKTIIYKKIKKLAGMASTYDYLIKYTDCVEEVKSLDYLVPIFKGALVLDGKPIRQTGFIFDLDEETLKILID
jgi:hypothetical protein